MKKWWILALAVVLAIGAVGVWLMMPTESTKLQKAMEKVDAALEAGEPLDLTDVADELANHEPQVIVNLLAFTLGYRTAAEKPCLLVGPLTMEMLQRGSITQEQAAEIITTLLQEAPISASWHAEDIRALPAMLACLSEQELIRALKMADVAGSEELQRILGDVLAQLPLTTVADVLAARFDAGLSGDTLVRRALALYTQEAIIAAMAAETDEARRNALARGYGLTLSGVDDVLTYLAEARAVGVPAQVCYPQGAVVAWDLSRLGRNGWPSLQLAEGARYLVVRVEEAEEAFEWRDVPLEMSMEDDGRYEGDFSPYYESNGGRWAETVTVTIDTAAMDATPEAFLPSDLSEVDAMVVLETRYVAWGSLRVQYGVRKGRDVLGKESFRDYRCYGVEQTVNVYTGNGRMIFRLANLETAPDAMNGRTDGFSDNYTEANLRRRCHARPDEEWMQARYAGLLTLLQENGGDLGKAVGVR